MNALRIEMALAAALLGFFVQAAAAQPSPTYQKLDDSPAPTKLRGEPALLSRAPRTICMALSPDGGLTRSLDIEGRVWQRPVGQSEKSILVAETNCEPACAVFSPDGRRLAFAAAEGELTVLDLDTGRTRFRDSLPDRAVALAFSSDGRRLAGVTVAGKVCLWSSDTGKRVGEWAANPNPVQTVAFSPDGRLLGIASYGHDVKLWEVDSPKGPAAEPRTVQAGDSRVTTFAFSPSGKQLVIATADGAVKVHDLSADRRPVELGAYPFASWSIVFDSGGERMAAGSWDGTVRLWDAQSWEPLQSVKKHDESVSALIFDGGQGLTSAGLDGRLLYWSPDIHSVRPYATIAGRNDSAWVTTYSPDGRRLFVGGREGRFELWDVEDDKLLVTRTGHPTTRCASFSPDGTLLVTGGDDGNIFLCDSSTGKTIRTLVKHPGSVSAVIFADDGRTLVSACDAGLVKVWDIATGQEQATWREHRQQIYCASFSPDGKWLLTGGGNWTTGDPGELFVWEWPAGRVRARLGGHRLAVWSIVFLVDGKRFAASDSSGAVKIWNVETLAEERTLQHPTWLRPLAVSPDGETLAVGQGDGSIRLWDTATWTEQASCDGHKSFPFWLQYAPDGKTLAAGASDGTILFWTPPQP
ncbi:MAG TPA: WD40 repeat domain-containing protein [Pirellulales bacterium]|nr:WD40 repeat domain-containing protein [Pirellulales bacterium]